MVVSGEVYCKLKRKATTIIQMDNGYGGRETGDYATGVERWVGRHDGWEERGRKGRSPRPRVGPPAGLSFAAMLFDPECGH